MFFTMKDMKSMKGRRTKLFKPCFSRRTSKVNLDHTPDPPVRGFDDLRDRRDWRDRMMSDNMTGTPIENRAAGMNAKNFKASDFRIGSQKTNHHAAKYTNNAIIPSIFNLSLLLER
jgi:hypothetical protein